MTNQLYKTGSTPLVLIILDGWGLAPPAESNAIWRAQTPIFDFFWQNYPHTQLEASGEAVGLLPKQVGNSEAGHMNLGAGRVVPQDISRIHQAIKDGTFFKNPALAQAAQHTLKNHSNLHIMGLLSGPNSGHSHPLHLLSLLKYFRQKRVKNIYLHLFTDGRDTSPHSGLSFINKLSLFLKKNEQIATIAGRFYLDRRKYWQRTEKIYNSLILKEGLLANSASQAIEEAYARGETDEFIMPTLIQKGAKLLPRITDNDAIIFFNLRSDRARQLTKPFVQTDFNKKNPTAFRRKKVLKNIVFVAMTDFGPDLGNILTAFPSPDIHNTLPMVLKNLKQLYIAESEKFAQVTYFFNGGWTDPVGGETRLKIDSPTIAHFDNKPEMAAPLLTKKITEFLKKRSFDFIVLNFANADMVAHTGNLEATTQACQIIDHCLGLIKKSLDTVKGYLIITGDHGNAEVVTDPVRKKIDTEHNTNPVPLIIYHPRQSYCQFKLKPGRLADVAPTLLEIMALPQPAEMTGISLIRP